MTRPAILAAWSQYKQTPWCSLSVEELQQAGMTPDRIEANLLKMFIAGWEMNKSTAMKKVTKREYINAQKVIRLYNEQMKEGKYGFLYFKNLSSDASYKLFEAKNIDEACIKMKVFVVNLGDDVLVDYEVDFNGGYIDISENQYLKNYVG